MLSSLVAVSSSQHECAVEKCAYLESGCLRVLCLLLLYRDSINCCPGESCNVCFECGLGKLIARNEP